MSYGSYGIVDSEMATLIKGRNGTITLSPNGSFFGVELSNEKMQELYTKYAELLLKEVQDRRQ